MNYDFIYYTTDSSFDYLSPFGVSTEHIEDWHGFSIELTNDDKPLIETLEGYGDFAVEIDKIKTLEQLKEFILKNMNEIRDSGTKEEVFLELVSFIDDWGKNDN